MENVIDDARKALQPITYEPYYTGFFVKKNGVDQGGADFCENCIKQAVKDARRWHRERRTEIIKNHEMALAAGKYSEAQVKKSRRSQLKYYPAKASFAHEGHDPDFGGGLTSPCCCDGCGEYFQCEFEANKDEAEYLLSLVQEGGLSERNKWELDKALYNFKYLKPEVQELLEKAARKYLTNK